MHPRVGEPARRVLVWCSAAYRGGLSLLAPLTLHDDVTGTFTSKARRILEDVNHWRAPSPCIER